MTIRKLNKIPNGNVKVVIDDNGIHLISYTTEVANIINNVLTVNGLYSMTTRKHISAFMNEYLNLPYTIAKHCVENNCKYDVIDANFIV